VKQKNIDTKAKDSSAKKKKRNQTENKLLFGEKNG
jgi:hypothetical protein